MHPLPILLLAVALVPMAHLLFGRRRPAQSGRRYPRMLRASWLRFGVPPVLLLGLTGQWRAFWVPPPVFAPAAVFLGIDGLSAADRHYLIAAGAVGVAIGILLGTLVTAARASRGRPEGTLFGDASALRPRNAGEFGWTAAISITAGVTEEAYFRLLLPLFATQATGSAVTGFAGATLLFGAAHRYQGWRGVAATTVAGAALSVGYLATGSLLAMMAFHAAGDLGHLVLRPAVRGWIERQRGAGSQPAGAD